MRLTIDTDIRTLTFEAEGEQQTIPLYSTHAFELISHQWLKVGWNQKYTYTFTWMGRPIIQLPEDLVRIQEVISRGRPDVILETGIAHGGSLVYYASLCRALGRGRVIGVDREIRPHNRAAIESHELASYITLVEGDSVDAAVVSKVSELISPGEQVMVVLDSAHGYEHVRRELDAYHTFVSPGSYIVATDGIMEELHDVPRGKPGWRGDNPAAAARAFVQSHPEFELQRPPWPFNESELTNGVTHWPGAWIRRR